MKNVLVTDTDNNGNVNYGDFEYSIMVYGLIKKQISIIRKKHSQRFKSSNYKNKLVYRYVCNYNW